MSGNFLFEVMLPLASRIAFPGVVDVDVYVSRRFHAARHDGVGHTFHIFGSDASGEFIPAVPTHRRRLGQAVIRHLVQSGRRNFRRRSACTCGRPYCRDLFTGLRHYARPCNAQFAIREFRHDAWSRTIILSLQDSVILPSAAIVPD